MKVCNFGSLNFDKVYAMEHFVEPKETLASVGYMENFGGKGLNQSIALAKAGEEVYHAGKVGKDGQPFIDYLRQYGVKTDYLVKDDATVTGHAIIQTCKGENCIILFGGANQAVTGAQEESSGSVAGGIKSPGCGSVGVSCPQEQRLRSNPSVSIAAMILYGRRMFLSSENHYDTVS